MSLHSISTRSSTAEPLMWLVGTVCRGCRWLWNSDGEWPRPAIATGALRFGVLAAVFLLALLLG
jgi:hypothetical protein